MSSDAAPSETKSFSTSSPKTGHNIPLEPLVSNENHPADATLSSASVFPHPVTTAEGDLTQTERQLRESIACTPICPEWLGAGRAMVLRGVFSPEECQRMIAFLEETDAERRGGGRQCAEEASPATDDNDGPQAPTQKTSECPDAQQQPTCDDASSGSAAAAAALLVPANQRKDYRNCDRCVVDAPDVASVLLERVRPFLQMPQFDDIDPTSGACVTANAEAEASGAKEGPTSAEAGGRVATPPAETIDITPQRKHLFLCDGVGMYGRWKLRQMNHRFRLCRYKPGGHFAPHHDGEFSTSPDCRSLKTFMIYLNGGFDGGTTNFLTDHDLYFDEEKKIFRARDDHVRYSLHPQAGDCLIFDHRILHEGGVLEGDPETARKYIMRTDILYDRIEKWSDPRYDEAANMVREAQRYEALGGADNLMKAVALYQKAFKMCPEIERQL